MVDWNLARTRCMREALRYTRCPATAEDVVQEAMLRAWKNHGALRDPSRSTPWLLQITRNEALRAIGRPAFARETPVPDAPDRADDGSLDEHAALRVDVQRALQALPQSDRALADLRYRADLTLPELADIFAMPVGTCKVRLHRLRKRLRPILEEE